MSTSFPVSKFYSCNKSNRDRLLEVKLEKSVCELRNKPLPPTLHSSLDGHPIDWKIFSKQIDALNYMKERGLGLMTFAFEEQVPGSEGRRKYVVTHPTNMWKNHVCRPPDQRCSYEVIPCGDPCKLYFDLEFDKTANPSSDGEQMVSNLLTALLWAFEDSFEVKLSESDILRLDASTPKKFSQHLILQTSEFAFQDNCHAGGFVNYVMGLVKNNKIPVLTVVQQQSLFVKNRKGEPVSFCDLGVYSKNRNFRLFLSSKFEKKNPLVIAETNQYSPNGWDSQDWPSLEAAFFSSSLITYFKPNAALKMVTFSNTSIMNETASAVNTSRMFLSNSSIPSLDGYSFSPWSEIDKFIAGLVAPKGTIRKWVYFQETETIVFLISGNRYCSNIGREHKSNHVKYVVHIPNGTYYQSCYDPDCANVRPTPQPIPPENLPWLNLLTDC